MWYDADNTFRMDKEVLVIVNDYNKGLWLLFIIALNGIISTIIKYTKSKCLIVILNVLFIIILLFVSISWVYFDYWK